MKTLMELFEHHEEFLDRLLDHPNSSNGTISSMIARQEIILGLIEEKAGEVGWLRKAIVCGNGLRDITILTL